MISAPGTISIFFIIINDTIGINKSQLILISSFWKSSDNILTILINNSALSFGYISLGRRLNSLEAFSKILLTASFSSGVLFLISLNNKSNHLLSVVLIAFIGMIDTPIGTSKADSVVIGNIFL